MHIAVAQNVFEPSSLQKMKPSVMPRRRNYNNRISVATYSIPKAVNAATGAMHG